jgi:hypothetical protein
MVFVSIYKINKNTFLSGVCTNMLPHFLSYFFCFKKRLSVLRTPYKMDIDFYKRHCSVITATISKNDFGMASIH